MIDKSKSGRQPNMYSFGLVAFKSTFSADIHVAFYLLNGRLNPHLGG
jgi:hypothetical protein